MKTKNIITIIGIAAQLITTLLQQFNRDKDKKEKPKEENEKCHHGD